MAWKILLVLLTLLDKVVDKFVPNRKEHNTDKYHRVLADIQKKSKKRQEEINKAKNEININATNTTDTTQ